MPADPIRTAARAASRDLGLEVEQRLRTILAPKPWWLPRPLWRSLLRRLLTIKVSTPKVVKRSRQRRLQALTMEDLIAAPVALEDKLRALVGDPHQLAGEIKRRMAQGRFQPASSTADRLLLMVTASLWPEVVK